VIRAGISKLTLTPQRYVEEKQKSFPICNFFDCFCSLLLSFGCENGAVWINSKNRYESDHDFFHSWKFSLKLKTDTGKDAGYMAKLSCLRMRRVGCKDTVLVVKSAIKIESEKRRQMLLRVA
jgi:hypothetical protein